MALKFEVSDLTTIPEALRGEYAPVDAADLTKGYRLGVEGLPQQEDVGPLKRALERVKSEHDAAKLKLQQAGQDTAALETSYKAQIEGLSKQIEDGKKQTRKELRESAALKLATELGGDHAVVLLPHLRERLRAEEVEGDNLVRVLTPDGKASALSLADLVTEFRSNKAFAAVITASRASGGGASQGSRPGDAGGVAVDSTKPPPSDPVQLAQWTKLRREARGQVV